MRLKGILLLVLFCAAKQTNCQTNVKKLIVEKCSEKGMLTDLTENGGILINPITADYISSWSLLESEAGFTQVVHSKSVKLSQSELITFNKFPGLKSINHLSLSDDSTYTFSVLKNGRYDLYVAENGKLPQRIFQGTSKESYLHPYITNDGDQIYFSSNTGSGIENYDIFLINKLTDTWSSPIRLNTGVNDIEHQFFPTFYNDTLYFSKEENGTLDLFWSAKADQFSTATKMEEPFNSANDDFLFHQKNDQIAYITSNREGNIDTPYVISKKLKMVKEKLLITGYLACSGNRIPNIPIVLQSVFGIKMDDDITDQDGNFILKSDKSVKKYKLKLDNKDPRVKDCAVLYLTDKSGNVTQKISINDENEFIFEIINPDEIKDLQFKSLKDESLLQIELDGQIYENKPGDIGQGEPVKILSEEGDVIALAYTSPDGTFNFNDLSPDSKYNLKFDESAKHLKLNIIKDGEIIPVPISNNTAIYERISEENIINIIDDRGQEITIAKNEFFNLQNIFYETNSSTLSEIAKFQLTRLSNLILNNESVSLDLISHTDCKGEKEYNLMLSKKRSLKALEFLVSKGVSREKLTAQGKGESEPLNQCIDGVTCTEEQHGINRRTEIRIVIR